MNEQVWHEQLPGTV